MATRKKIVFDSDTETVCVQNGISREQFFSGLHQIVSIELCHFNLDAQNITGLIYFTNLTSLCIVAQDIVEMSGIEHLVHLEQLWICETRVARISSLDHLRVLEKLFLYNRTL